MVKIQKRYLIWSFVALILIVLFVAYCLDDYFYPSTDNAYTGGNFINVSPQVTGPIQEILIKNNQTVEVGQLMFTIDNRPFILALQQAQFQLQVLQKAYDQATMTLKAAEYNVPGQESIYKKNLANYRRMAPLYRNKYLTAVDLMLADSNVKVSEAAFKQAQAQVIELQNKLKSYEAQIAMQESIIKQQQLNLSYTKVYAPFTGAVANLSLSPGAVVTANQPLFTLVQEGNFWVDANFKETQLKRVKSGQTATVTIDIYGSQKFKGTVEGVSPASGALLSILPPENYSGNWVKVTQRVPVRILLGNLPALFSPPIGTSAEVTVDTVNK